jgi:hypothetical protein
MKPLTPDELADLERKMTDLAAKPGAAAEALATDASFREAMARLADEGLRASYRDPRAEKLAAEVMLLMRMLGPTMPGERTN